MYIRLTFLVAVQLCAASTSTHAGQMLLQSFRTEIEPIFESCCYDCHGNGSSEGGVVLDAFTADTIDDHKLWLRVLKNVRAHIMPPLEGKQPTAAERTLLSAWVKAGPFAIDPVNPDPGKSVVQRLNRTEYQNTIRDLIGVKFDALDEFPADNTGQGFDNIGELLTLSPMMLEKYLDAANRIVSQAVPTQSLVIPEHVLTGAGLVDMFSSAPADDASDDDLQMSFYKVSNRSADYEVTVAGDYQIVVEVKPVSFLNFRGFDYNRCRFVTRVDGVEVVNQEFENTYGKKFEYQVNRYWQAGKHRIEFEVEPTTSGLDDVKNLKLEVEQLTVRGPMSEEHWKKPVNYDQFFPGKVPDEEAARVTYTNELLTEFATRAFRRPVDRETVDRLVQLATDVSHQDGYTYEKGVSQAMIAILASPRFLFREEGVEKLHKTERFPLVDEYALASRLSYFFWSSMPDEELFRLAEAGELRTQLDFQIERMMKDARFDSFLKHFAGQWLHAEDIESVNISSREVLLREEPDQAIIGASREYKILREIPENRRTPEQQAAYSRSRAILRAAGRSRKASLRSRELRAMREETEMYFEHVIRDDRSLAEFIDSDYTFLNDRLATLYDIDGVTGSEMRKVMLEANSPRGGVLTQGTILAFTSNPTRTSPVKRGVFVLENILGTPPAAPPPNIPALEDVAGSDADRPVSLRASLALHRENQLCSSCHSRMDPLGLALENFNAMGMWRESELGLSIDVAGQLVTGEQFTSVQEMKRILATDRLQDFYYCFSEKLLTYALGRGIEYSDTETVDQLVETLESANGRPSALIRAICHSAPFQKRRRIKVSPEDL